MLKHAHQTFVVPYSTDNLSIVNATVKLPCRWSAQKPTPGQSLRLLLVAVQQEVQTIFHRDKLQK